MFEIATLRNLAVNGQDIDAGTIAETLLFYNKVHILAQRGSISKLVETIGRDNLLWLIKNKFISLTYTPTTFGAMTNTSNYLSTYRFVGFRISETENNKKIRSPQADLEEILERSFGRDSAARRFTKALVEETNVNKSFVDDYEKMSIDFARDMLLDKNFTTACIKGILLNLCPKQTVNDSVKFDLFPSGDDFIIDTDIDFKQLNSGDLARFNLIADITPAHIMSAILEASADIKLAAENMAEIVTVPLTSRIISNYTSDIIRKRVRNANEIDAFQDVYLAQFGSIRESINSGHNSFADFMAILDESRKFRTWIHGVGPDANLINEYYKACTQDTWVDKLPGKSARFALFNGLGLAAGLALGDITGPAVGMAVSALDTFVFDKLAKGWNPSHFIEGPIRRFLK